MKLEFLALTAALALSMPLHVSARSANITSPSGKINVTLADGNDGLPVFGVDYEGQTLYNPSAIGMKIRDRKAPLKIKGVKKAATKTEKINAPFHHSAKFDFKYNEMTADLGEGLSVTFRVFDDGMAYRFNDNNKGNRPVIVDDEVAEYALAGNPTMTLAFSTNANKPEAMAFQNYYTVSPLHSTSDKVSFMPVAADHGNVKSVILESDLESYPGMFLKTDSVSGTLKGVFAKYPDKTALYEWRAQEYVTSTRDFIADTKSGRTYPWRIISITEDDRQLPASNLVYALASPSRVADTSWIKPGKVAWDWWNDWGLRGVDFKAGINNETYKYYIDFAAKNGIEYIVLDEGWYNPKGTDMLTVIDDIDLPELVRYGKEKGVDIVLWTVFNVLDGQLEEACKKYSEMGIKGFKVDFLDRDDQTAVEMAYRLAEACARYNMMLDYHGFYKPTGLNRTYPNIVNFEAVFGMEEMKWSDPSVDMAQYDVTFPYLRMMCGPVDYTPGAMRNAQPADWKPIYYNPMSQGTRAHQTATYIVHDSPFTMLCDSPSLYEKNQDWVDFVTVIPTVFEDVDIVGGKMGEYIVTLRQNEGKWYAAGLTNRQPRHYDMDFSFLPEGSEYKVTILEDGVNAAKQGDDYKISRFKADNKTVRKIHMAPGGGFALRVEPCCGECKH